MERENGFTGRLSTRGIWISDCWRDRTDHGSAVDQMVNRGDYDCFGALRVISRADTSVDLTE